MRRTGAGFTEGVLGRGMGRERTGLGAAGNGAGDRSAKKVSTGTLMFIGTCACGMDTRDGSGSGLTLVKAGGGGGASGGGFSAGGGGGGSMVTVSISRTSRSGTWVSTVKRRAMPSTAKRMAEAAMPMMVDLRFKFHFSVARETELAPASLALSITETVAWVVGFSSARMITGLSGVSWEEGGDYSADPVPRADLTSALPDAALVGDGDED